MENKIVFREMLTEIKKAADASGNRITRSQVQELLAGLPLEKEHFELVYDYLAEQNIRVVDSLEEEEKAQEAPQGALASYVNELLRMEQEMSEDEQLLMRQAMAGSALAREQLIGLYLPVICARAESYEDCHLPVEDMIQEGNLGLMTAISTLEEYSSPAACRAHIFNSIVTAMETAAEQSRRLHDMSEGMVSRVNHLHEAVKNLERDLEHRVSAEEISAYLEMPLEEILDILRMSGDQIGIKEND